MPTSIHVTTGIVKFGPIFVQVKENYLNSSNSSAYFFGYLLCTILHFYAYLLSYTSELSLVNTLHTHHSTPLYVHTITGLIDSNICALVSQRNITHI